MNIATDSVERHKTGRSSATLLAKLSHRIAAGEFAIGSFMPSQRDLIKESGLAQNTVRRALKHLEAEGWVRAEGGKGYRVLAHAMDPDRGAPIAFLVSEPAAALHGESHYAWMLSAFREALSRRSWSLLGVGTEGVDPADIVEQLKHARVAGVILDHADHALIEAVRALGIPAVMVDAWDDAAGLDTIQQDHFGGAVQAAQYVAHAGHRRVAWVGANARSPQYRERWGGVSACLQQHGIGIPAKYQFDANDADYEERLRAVLQRPDRPTALIALWGELAIQAARLVADTGLSPGRDVDIVGWCAEERYAPYTSSFPNRRAPPTVVWSLAGLADAAVARLAERRARPDLSVIRLQVATRLCPASERHQKLLSITPRGRCAPCRRTILGGTA